MGRESRTGSREFVLLHYYRACQRLPLSSVVPEQHDFRSGGENEFLLVEDDPGVRTMSAEVLRKEGYHVLVAPSASDALQLAEKHEGPLDLLLTDVVMPGMTGPELADKFTLHFPIAFKFST